MADEGYIDELVMLRRMEALGQEVKKSLIKQNEDILSEIAHDAVYNPFGGMMKISKDGSIERIDPITTRKSELSSDQD